MEERTVVPLYTALSRGENTRHHWLPLQPCLELCSLEALLFAVWGIPQAYMGIIVQAQVPWHLRVPPPSFL